MTKKTRYHVQVLGCDNDAGRFERGGDFTGTHSQVNVERPDELARAIVRNEGYTSPTSSHRIEARDGLHVVSVTVHDAQTGRAETVVFSAQEVS